VFGEDRLKVRSNVVTGSRRVVHGDDGSRGEERGEDAMTVVAVIFRRMETAVAVRNLWTRGYEPYADGGGAPVRAGSVGRLGPSRRTTEQYHYRLRKEKIHLRATCMWITTFPPKSIHVCN
jgi:hypothetical protein